MMKEISLSGHPACCWHEGDIGDIVALASRQSSTVLTEGLYGDIWGKQSSIWIGKE